MRDVRMRLVIGADRLLGATLATTIVGAILAFGGVAWWAKPASAIASVLLGLTWLVRTAAEGRLRLLRTPMVGLGLAGLLLGVAQLTPLPASMVARVSSRSAEMQAAATFPPGGPAALGRSAATVDRPATLRTLGGMAACLVVFGLTGLYADRVGRLKLIWGSLIVGFGVSAAFGLAQAAYGTGAFYGLYEPGEGPAWAPSQADLRVAPGVTRLRAVELRGAGVGLASTAIRSDPAPAVGPLPGGPGAFLALASIVLPLAIGLTLQTMGPKGSREPLSRRLREEGGLAKVILLTLTIIVGSALVGAFGGRGLALAMTLGIVVAGLGAAWGSGARWASIGLAVVALLALGGGVRASEQNLLPPGWVDPSGSDWRATVDVWAGAGRIARDFPILGSGLGTFPTVIPRYKSADATPTTAQSSLAQWVAESGVAGIGLLGIGLFWAAWRLPSAIARVGAADRPLAFAILGSALSFLVFSTVHWTVQLPAVAMAASAVGGTLDRWLAGGTDLFLDRIG